MTPTVPMTIIDPGCFVLPNSGRTARAHLPRGTTGNDSHPAAMIPA